MLFDRLFLIMLDTYIKLIGSTKLIIFINRLIDEEYQTSMKQHN